MKTKGQIRHCTYHKDIQDGGIMVPVILNLKIRMTCMADTTLWLLHRHGMSLGGPHSRCGHFWRRNKLSALCRDSNHYSGRYRKDGAKVMRPVFFSSETVITIVMKFAYAMGTCRRKFRISFHKVSSIINTLFH